MLAPQPITLRDLTLGYDGHPAVHHLSGVIQPGALLAVVGPNGAGKSTLIKALAGLLKPIGGRIDGLAGQRVAYATIGATRVTLFGATPDAHVASLAALLTGSGLVASVIDRGRGVDKRAVKRRGKELLKQYWPAQAMERAFQNRDAAAAG